VPGGFTPSYQWYSNTIDSNTGGIRFLGATNSSFPIPATLTTGTYYYFCEVSIANGTVSIRSDVARVNVTAPVITIVTQPPTVRELAYGSTNNFFYWDASVTGNATLSFQWYRNTANSNVGGTAVSGASHLDSLTIPATLAPGTYYYYCLVTATGGAAPVRTNVMRVNILAPVITITTQPFATTDVVFGSISGSLNVAASTTSGTLSYQWYSSTTNSNTSGSIISGATSSSFTIPTTLAGGTYYYHCLVTVIGGAASVRSNVARVNVEPPVITINTQPVATTNVVFGNINNNLNVEANVTLEATLSYQWYSNTTNSNTGGSIISGATNANFTIPTTLAVGIYYYFCEVRATGGAAPVRSGVARVNVAVPVITIDTQPTATTNVVFGNIVGSLGVTASVIGEAMLSYQWYSNTTNNNTGGSVISGANSTSYTIPTTLIGGTYFYFCEVRATGGALSVRSSVATVNVASPIITIDTQPSATTDVAFGNINSDLNVAASVTLGATLSYQWYSSNTNNNTGGSVITGANSTSFTIPTTLIGGTYFYFCEVSATGGSTSVRSNVARVNVTGPLITINIQPSAITNVNFGNISGSLNVVSSVTDNATLSYQWYRNTSNSNTGGNIISGANSASYTIPTTLTGGSYYYYCLVTATGGATSVRSNVARVSVIVPVEMVWVPSGSFELGRELNPSDSLRDVTPVSTVTISGFYMGKYQVTQEQYHAVMQNYGSGWGGSGLAPGEIQGRRAVDQVSWYNAIVFCNRLSMIEGLTPAYRINGSTNPSDWGSVPDNSNSEWDAVEIVSGSNGYRLPTEAQWEYVAKGGNGSPGNFTYSGSNDPNTVAWYRENNIGEGPREVGKKAPNSLGIYDMSGNVDEWCWDWMGSYTIDNKTNPTGPYSGTRRVHRGGQFYLRSVTRGDGFFPFYWGGRGFRISRP